MYSKVDIRDVKQPSGYVTFSINERVQRVKHKSCYNVKLLPNLFKNFVFKILIWINNNFILDEELETDGIINIAFVALRTNNPLIIKMELNGQFTIFTDDMELAGSLIQSLVTFLNIIDLQVNCDFPEELENLSQILVQVD